MNPVRPAIIHSSLSLSVLLLLPPALAQQPDSASSNPPPANSQGSAPAQSDQSTPADSSSPPADQSSQSSGGSLGPSSLLGPDWPQVDPSTGYIQQNGNATNAYDNHALRSQITTFLSQAPPSAADAQEYKRLFDEMFRLMEPTNPGGQNPNQAWALLSTAATFDNLDGGHSTNIANAIFQAWLAKNSVRDIDAAEIRMQRELENLERSLDMLQTRNPLERGVNRAGTEQRRQQRDQERNRQQNQNNNQNQSNNNNNNQGQSDQNQSSGVPETPLNPAVPPEPIDARAASLQRRIAEVQARRAVGYTSGSSATLAAKTEFHVTIATLFLLRRYDHCKLACAFYRYLFQDSSSAINLEQDSQAQRFFSNGLGTSPTVNAVELAASEAIRKVESAVEAFHFQVEHNQLFGASERVTEAVLIGESLPEVQLIQATERQKVANYLNLSARLLDQLQAKDWDGAEVTLNEVSADASDFRYTAQVRSQVNAQRNASNLKMGQARMAQLQNNAAEFTRLSSEAFELWPGNPQISALAAPDAGLEAQQLQQTLNEFDRLYSAGDTRAIFERRVEFGRAAATDPTRLARFEEITQNLGNVQGLLVVAEGTFSQGQAANAWEITEDLLLKHPGDSAVLEANRRYQQEASEFVAALRDGQRQLERENYGSALSNFLAAQEQYPRSRYADEGINKILNEILPENR